MMIPLLLLTAAFGVAAVLLLVFVGRYADRGVRLAHADETITALQQQLEEALARQENLTGRVENLEAIVISEAWDAFQAGHVQEGAASLALPEAEPSDEEKAALLARRQRAT